MIAFQDDQIQRVVIPRWLTYADAIASAELFVPGSERNWSDPTFDDEMRAFRADPVPLLAADLLGRALFQRREAELREIAEYIVRTIEVRAPTKELAARVLGANQPAQPDEKTQKLIEKKKKELRDFPRDAIGWVDLGRLYTILNQKSHAERAIRIAVGLAPNDRFCIRAAARCFLHFHDFEQANALFEGESERLRDPWLLATAASVASIAKKPSPLPRRMRTDFGSPVVRFHHSELLEAFGMEEFDNGKDRSSRKIFRQAWADPSANVATHAEWLTRVHFPGLRKESRSVADKSKAALSQAKFAEGDVDSALVAVEEWMLEEPYSVQPFVWGSYLASVKDDFKRVVAYYEDARQRNLLHPLLLNNVAYALLELNDLQSAEEILQSLRKYFGERLGFTLTATEGFFEIKSGKIEAGNALYEAAIAAAEPAMKNRVKLHKYLTLLRSRIPISEAEVKEFAEIRRESQDVNEKFIIKKIEDTLRRAKEEATTP